MRLVMTILILISIAYIWAFDLEPGNTDTINIIYQSKEPVFVLGAYVIEVPKNIDCILNFVPEMQNNEMLMNKTIRKNLYSTNRELINTTFNIDTLKLDKRITVAEFKFIVDRSSDINRQGGKIKIGITDGFNTIDTKEYEVRSTSSISGVENNETVISSPEILFCSLSKSNQWYINVPNSELPFNLKIYNVNGRLIKTVCENETGASIYLWNGKDEYNNQVNNGIYFVRYTTENKSEINKIWVLK